MHMKKGFRADVSQFRISENVSYAITYHTDII